MALTIYNKPRSVALSSSENYFTVLSNNTTSYSDFRYKIYQYDKNLDSSFTRYNELTQLPSPKSFSIHNPNDFLYFSDSTINISNFLYHNESAYTISGCKYYEYYNSTLQTSTVKPTELYCFLNGEENEYIGEFIYTDYELNGTGKKLLTDFENSRYFTLTSHQQISMLNGRNFILYPGFSNNIDLEVYNDYIFFEVYLNTYENIFSAPSAYNGFRGYILNSKSGNTEVRVDINLNVPILNSQTFIVTHVYRDGTWTSFNKTTSNFITSNCKFYDIYTTSNTTYTNRTSKKYRFKLKKDECLFDIFNIMWINRLSGVESFIFKGYTKKEFNVKKDEYSKTRYDININTGLLERSYNDKDMFINNKSVEKSYNISTGFIESEYYDLFTDMLSSSDVYLVENSTLIPIKFITNSLSVKNKNSEGLVNFTFEFMKNIRKKYKKY